MKISFWSNADRARTAEVLTLSALSCCLSFPCKIVAMENYINTENLGFHMLGSRYDRIRNSYEQYAPGNFHRGDTFLQHLHRQTGRGIRFRKTMEILQDALYFLPMNQSLMKEVYEYGFDHELEENLDYCSMYFDFTFVNVEKSRNLSTKTILDLSDRIIMCLPTDMNGFEQVYNDYHSILPKVFFVFYGKDFRTFSRKVQKKYPFVKKRFAQLEFTPKLCAYLSEGRASDYMCRFYHVNRGHSEYRVINKLKYIAFRIIRQEIEISELPYREMAHLFYERNHPKEAVHEEKGEASAMVEEKKSSETSRGEKELYAFEKMQPLMVAERGMEEEASDPMYRNSAKKN